MEFGIFIFLILAGIVAGIVSVVSSMASLVSYPALLMVGVSPVYANMTNTAALIFTGGGAALSSLKEIKATWRKYLWILALAMAGALCGSLLLTAFPGKVFEKLVPFFVLLSALLFLLSHDKNAYKREQLTGVKKLAAYFGIFLSGLYTGYFGAAAGVLLLFVLTKVTDDDFIVQNAFKNVIGSLGNLIALLVFIFTSKVYWNRAIPLAIGLFIGGYLGQKLIHYLPLKLVKWITFVFAIFLALYLGYQAYM